MSISGKPFEQESIYLPILPGPGDLHVRVAGRARGKPLLLFHGSGPDVTWRTWEPQMDAFGEVRRVYALDWPGWGDSAGERPTGPERFNPAPMIAMALQVMDVLDIGRMDIGGVSWGGLIGLELALTVPERVDRLLLVDAACRPEDLASGRYEAVAQPVCLAWAEEDPLIPLSLGRALAAALPNCSLHVFPGSTHWPHHLHADAFNEMAVTFLDTSSQIDKETRDPSA